MAIVTRKETIRLGYTSYLEHMLLAPDSSFQSPFQGFVDHGERFIILKVSASSKLNSRPVDSFAFHVCRLENFSQRNATSVLAPTLGSGSIGCHFSVLGWNREVDNSGRLGCRSEEDI